MRGRLLSLGDYPGIVPDEIGQKIPGKIFRLPQEPEVLNRLDEYEEFDATRPQASLFIRRKLPVTRNGGSKKLSCWTYVYNEHAGVQSAVSPDSSRSRKIR